MALSILDVPTRGEGDPIDSQLSELGAAPARVDRGSSWQARMTGAWTSGASPILLLLIGAALGPRGLSLLTPGVMSAIDPAVPVALAALGVHLALHIEIGRPRTDVLRWTVASIAALLSAGIVCAGLFLLIGGVPAAPFDRLLVAIGAGICAAMTWVTDSGSRTRSTSTLAIVLPIVLGGLLLAWVREDTARETAAVFAQAAILPMLIAGAAWLLLSRTTADTDGRIVALAALLLTGGLADYLSLSGLFSGFVAGVCWRVASGPGREAMLRAVGFLRHPLAVFLLLLAGAHMTTVSAPPALLIAYPLLALVGGLAGELLMRRLPDPHEAETALQRVAPGVYGIAFAMSLVRTVGPQADPLLPIVAIGTIALQLFAGLRAARERAA